MNSMFELLMGLPLFQGASRETMERTVGTTKFHFLKFPAGETIIREHETCDHLSFIISGSVRSTVVNSSGSFAVAQTLTAPAILSPDFLFGRVTVSPATVVAIDQTSVLQLSKPDFINILKSDEVYLFNYLNLLSVNAQKCQVGLTSLTNGDLDERIAYWITALTQKGGTDIRLTARTRDLCSIFGTQRMFLNPVLERMKEDGLLDFTNKELIINSRDAMIKLLYHSPEA